AAVRYTLSLPDALPICGVEVVDGHGVFDHVPADLVGLPDGLAPLHAAAGHPEGERERVVVAARDGLVADPVLAERRPAELGRPRSEEHTSELQSPYDLV